MGALKKKRGVSFVEMTPCVKFVNVAYSMGVDVAYSMGVDVAYSMGVDVAYSMGVDGG